MTDPTAAPRWSSPAALLRLEGLATLAAAVALYAGRGHSWWLFAAVLLAPDLAMLAYLAGPRWGSVGYNLAHTLIFPLVLLGAGVVLHRPLIEALALIWLAHIGMDRTVGYGLKYSTAFKHTHLERV